MCTLNGSCILNTSFRLCTSGLAHKTTTVPQITSFLSSWCWQHQVSYRTKALLKVHKKLQYILYCTLPRVCGVHFPPLHCPISCTDCTYCRSSTWETAKFKTSSCPTEDLNGAIMAIWGLVLKNFIIAIVVIIGNKKYYSFPCYWHNFTL